MHGGRTTAGLLLTIGFAVGGTAVAGDGDPIFGLTRAELQEFRAGRAAFAEEETAEDGLGPIFNGTSCGGCHRDGGVGGGSDTIEMRFGTHTDGVFDHMTYAGGSLIQTDGIGVQGACDYVGEVVPAEATIVAGRRTTPLFGLGLVDTVPDTTFLAIARLQRFWRPATAGRPNTVLDLATGSTVVGKFGWKSQVPNLMQFSADAYLNEMGITTPLFPDESCPQGDCAALDCDPVPGVDDDNEDVELFATFMRLLAPPSAPRHRLPQIGRFGRGPSPLLGSRIFDRIGCADCHLRTLTSGPSDVAALRFRTFEPFSDFLLHDMGDLGDGIEQGIATGREMRTAPLWGLRFVTTFLHDGRATTIEEAIRAHDGQGRIARNRFDRLSGPEKAMLIAFLGAL